jgi:oligopeptide transport system substrate-binding protein
LTFRLEPRSRHRVATRSTLRLAALACFVAATSCAPAAPPDARVAGASGAAQWFGDVTPPIGQVFTFNNGAEPETIDPGKMSGQPDGRVARMLFEGLTTPHPATLAPEPGQAYRWDVSADGRTYTFHLRPDLKWSDGRPVTAHDFAWSWMRVLEPETAARYATFLYPIVNAEAYNKGEITDRARVGIQATDDSTLVVRLNSPTPYFLFLTQYYTMLPVPRHVVEAHGARWTRPENLVGNGAFLLATWKHGNRFEFVKNPGYWDAASVRLEKVICFPVDDLNTSTNLYKAGVIDWNPSGYIPSQYVPYLRRYADFSSGRYQGTYFYSVNTTRPPFDKIDVRRALNYAVDRDAIARDLLKGSRDPWGLVAPSGYPGYEPPEPITFDPERAREHLARAGYPGGKGFPKTSILFNTSEDHRRIAEAVQAMWKRELGIDVELSNQEWGSYLQATTGLQYDVARRSWIGDYLDPNTFLGMWVTGDGNNRTGWSHPRYDALLRGAGLEVDAARRMAMLREAEALLLSDGPVIPIYHYVTTELVKPYVRGLHPTALDTHPLKHVWIDHEWRTRGTPVSDAGAAATEAPAVR